MSEVQTDCFPPPNTKDGSPHILSAEVGSGETRESFTAIWRNGMWHAIGYSALSPRKAGRATWEYEGPGNV